MGIYSKVFRRTFFGRNKMQTKERHYFVVLVVVYMEVALENLEHVIDFPNQPRDTIGNNYELPANLQVYWIYNLLFSWGYMVI